MLKLLSPQEQKDAKEQETIKSLWRAKEIQEVADKANRNLARSEADFALSMAKKNEQYAKEEEEHQQELKRRKEEINALEQKRLNLLIPLDVIKASADTKLKEANKFLLKLHKKDEKVDELTSLLEDKLDSVSEKEIRIQEETKVFFLKKEGLERQISLVKEGGEKLTREVAEFYALKAKQENEIAERKKEVTLQEINLKAKIDKFQRDKEALFRLEKKLIDERGTLERAFEEVRRMENALKK